MNTDIPLQTDHDAEGYSMIGAGFEVYNEMGNGYLDDVYQESLELELHDQKIPFVPKPKLPIFYKVRSLRKQYEADLNIFDRIIIELKAVKALLPEHEAQLLNYLKATGRRVRYLVHFGTFPKLDWRRRVR